MEAATATSPPIPNKKLAMWAFLASDCMFFGTLISTHLIYRKTEGFQPDATQIFDIHLTSASTFILLMSSLFMALAVSAAHKGNVRAIQSFLVLTLLFGGLFVGAQVYEFAHFVHEKDLTLSGSLFGSTFYTLTGTHGVHVSVGLFILAIYLLTTLRKKTVTMEEALNLEVIGLYWHFVDIVWIIIFPFVYILEYLV